MMQLTNECYDCLNAFEDLELVGGKPSKVMKCEYNHAMFPHASNCPTYIGEIVDARGYGIGDEIRA